MGIGCCSRDSEQDISDNEETDVATNLVEPRSLQYTKTNDEAATTVTPQKQPLVHRRTRSCLERRKVTIDRVLSAMDPVEREELQESFRALDVDQTGKISREEFMAEFDRETNAEIKRITRRSRKRDREKVALSLNSFRTHVKSSNIFAILCICPDHSRV